MPLDSEPTVAAVGNLERPNPPVPALGGGPVGGIREFLDHHVVGQLGPDIGFVLARIIEIDGLPDDDSGLPHRAAELATQADLEGARID